MYQSVEKEGSQQFSLNVYFFVAAYCLHTMKHYSITVKSISSLIEDERNGCYCSILVLVKGYFSNSVIYLK